MFLDACYEIRRKTAKGRAIQNLQILKVTIKWKHLFVPQDLKDQDYIKSHTLLWWLKKKEEKTS
jgi:DNA gyrase subunit A